jgi:hypothetical protein
VTPLEARFNDGMELVNRMKHDPRRSYWNGYVAGLMRGLFGAQAVKNCQHVVLSNHDAVGDEFLGYRDGYEKIVTSSSSSCQRHATEAWENEGGAVAEVARAEPQAVQLARSPNRPERFDT